MTNTDASTIQTSLSSLVKPLEVRDDLFPFVEEAADKRCVLLGEASHGTSEYYTWRRELSKLLIQEEGYSFIAVEGDWPDCYRINQYIKGYAYQDMDPREILRQSFRRWPTWMWANEEMLDLVIWLKEYNEHQPEEEKVGFYGLDTYSLWNSLYAVIGYLKEHAPDKVQAAYQAFSCFEPYGEDAQEYAQATYFVPTSCEDEVINVLTELSEKNLSTEGNGREEKFNALQNAYVLKNAEQYYRTMMHGGSVSWNVRDHHMMGTLDRLLSFHGKDAKGIVWEHNTHIGDARYTDMKEAMIVNIGQLVREKYGEQDVFLVGFGSYEGSVIAGQEWDAPMEKMRLPKARKGSWEELLHSFGQDLLLLFSDKTIPEELEEPISHRAIGVVYNPDLEYGNYVPSVMPKRYDAFCFIDKTEALHPLKPLVDHEIIPETYPSGF